MRHKFISVFLIVWIMLMMPMTVFAQNFDADQTGSVSITLTGHSNKMPVQGAEFSLYHVAVTSDESGDLSYTYTDAFKDFNTLPDDPSVVARLDAYIREYSVSAEKNVTDSQGRTVFRNLPLGLYFVKQTNHVDGYAPCKSFVVSVPNQTAGSRTYDIKATPKTEPEKFIDITIRKVWDVDELTEIADHVEVELLRDDVTVKTAALNEMNNWEVTYSNMPESDSYSIVELNIPEGFTAAYTRKGFEFTVTNSLNAGIGDDEEGDDSDIDDLPLPGEGKDASELIQTGQLVWPIPVLAMAGLCLIVVGTIVLRKTRDNNA